jgi:gamma-glutamyltranspeptidase/glutathione hydrolase
MKDGNMKLESDSKQDGSNGAYVHQGRYRWAISRRTVLKNSAITGVAGLVGVPTSAAASSTSTETGDQPLESDSQVTAGKDGMVVSDNPHASNIGAAVLRDGGNAIDTAIAVHFALNVVNPPMSGIGGGGTMMYYDADKNNISSLDFFPRAPEAVTPEYWIDENGDPLLDELQDSSGLSVAVPRTVEGLAKAHERFGSYPWEQLLSQSIDLARGGVVIDSTTGENIESNWDRFNDAAREVFSGPDGTCRQAGELLVQEDLADTLQLIADEGVTRFYEGEVAEAIADTVQRHQGEMTVEDLRDQESQFNEPMHEQYRGLDIYSPQLPITSGFIVPRILKQLERFDLGENYDAQSWQKHHLFAESTALAWADRAEYLGDPAFVDVPIEGLQNEDFIEERGAQITLENTLADYGNDECVESGDPWAYQNGSGEPVGSLEIPIGEKTTTHFSVADAKGNVVAITSSINFGMGSGLMVPGYGFMLNNYLTLFDAKPGGANEPEGGKGPLSSTSPTIIMKNGSPYFTSGSPGGTTIPQTTAQVILNVVEYGMNIADAVAEPRITTDHCPPIDWEKEVDGREGILDDARAETAELGHVWVDETDDIGAANNLLIHDGRYFGGPDPRRQSVAIGVPTSNNALK